MNNDLAFQLRVLSRIIYFVTEEEDRFLVQLRESLRDQASAKVYNQAFGLIPLTQLIDDWASKEHKVDSGTTGILEALTAIYKEPAPNVRKYYVITDPERWLQDQNVQRRLLNILHQVHNNLKTVKVIICVGTRRYIPEKLSRYIEVVHDTGLTADEITSVVTDTCSGLRVDPPADAAETLKGLTSFEVQANLIQVFRKTRGVSDKSALNAYRFRQLRKTDLVQYVDTAQHTFDTLGGAGRFKQWVRRTKAAWSPEGREFGLEPPRGVLAVGVHGTGKSLSAKTLSHEWGMPMLQLEMGRLRSSAVGESEANAYRAVKIIESVAPCIVWVDEAEKSLSGGQSSAYTDGGTTSRTIGIFSTWLQETKAPVCLAMTANSLRTLPVEFVNRMDERWFFDLPSKEDRIDILKIHMRMRKVDPANFDLAALSDKADRLVGREIEQCVKAALAESFDQKKPGLDETLLGIELARKPRIVNTMSDELKEILEWVGFDPGVDDGVRARYAADPMAQDRKIKVVG